MNNSQNSSESRLDQSNAKEDSNLSGSFHTSDLSGQVGSWLRTAIAFAELASKDIAAELKVVDAAWRLPSFRLAFVGEFSRGKSTLINRLIGQEILPVGALPTTATLTSIKSGFENRMEVRFADGHRETRPLDESSWNDLLATDQEEANQDPSAEVRLILNQPWLHEVDIELVDAPGAGDLSGKRAVLISQLLTQCDATVLLVSATMPFSVTEAVFLEQEVIGRHIPRILVVVSKLDTIPQDQRANVFNAIRDKVAQTSKDIPVLPLHPINTNHKEDEALEAVKTHIASMVSKEGRRAWRSQRVAGQIVDSLDHLVEVAETAISAIKMSAAERTKALQKVQGETRKAEIEWERIRLELDQRRIEYDKKLRAEIETAKLELMESLLLDLKKTSDIKSWWERDLPYRMRRELANFGRKFQTLVDNNLKRDFEWLQAEVIKAFTVKLTKQIPDSIEPNEIKPELGQFELTDIQQQRLWARISSGALGAASSIIGSTSQLVIAPLAAAFAIPIAAFAIPITVISVTARVGIGILTEQRMQASIEKQRNLLSQELETTLNRAMQQFSSSLSNDLRQLYLQLIEQIQQGQKSWQATKENAFKVSNHSANEKACQDIITKVTSLKKEIVLALNVKDK